MGYIEEKERLTLQQVTFMERGKEVALAAVDPVVFSETIRDLASVASAAT
jgi:hypothetical protein